VTLAEVRIGHEGSWLRLAEPEGIPRWRRRDGRLEAFRARLELPHLNAEGLVHLADTPLENSLADFLDGLASQWRGWKGEREWQTYEGTLALSCSHDRLGHVAVSTSLSDLSRSWLVHGSVTVDAGDLDRIARDVRSFLG